MAEDKMKNMQELNVDELDNVTGGSLLGDLASSVLGIGAKKTGLGKAVQAAECCTNALKGAAATDANTGSVLGKTVIAHCPVCGKDTEFEVFSGARARCNVCGNIRLDM